MKTSIKLITPEIATEMLSRNEHNRKYKPQNIRNLTRLMLAGLWKEETGETIKIAGTFEKGRLIDGQHRLKALTLANVSLSFIVVEDLDEGIFGVIDTGIKRSPGDTIYQIHPDMSSVVAAGMKKYFNLTAGLSSSTDRTISNEELKNLYLSRPDFWNAAATNCQTWYKKIRVLTKADFLGFYAYFREIHSDMAFQFMDELAGGSGLELNNPILILRNKLLLSLVSGNKITPMHKGALIIKAWNYFRNNQKVTRVYFSDSESFPKPI